MYGYNPSHNCLNMYGYNPTTNQANANFDVIVLNTVQRQTTGYTRKYNLRMLKKTWNI